MRLHIDEDVAAEIVAELRRSHDCLYPQEQARKGQSDVGQLHEASRGGRILITVNDRDFRFIHRTIVTVRRFDGDVGLHSGILTVTRRPEPVPWARAIDRILRERDSLVGRFLIWHPDKDRWDEDDWRPDD